MALTISREQARRFLVTYHLQQTDLPGVFAHLGKVQYDPLNPVGRNPDLVLQARVPGYRVNDVSACHSGAGRGARSRTPSDSLSVVWSGMSVFKAMEG